MRAAIYYTPAPSDPLARAAANWLGRNAFTGEETEPAVAPETVASPRRYGFHATMRAPFRLRDGMSLAELEAGLASFCATKPAVIAPKVVLARLGRFLAIVPASPPAALAELEHDLLEAIQPFRRALEPEEVERRNPDRLTERQRAHLAAWGYPYVLDEYRFHLTLTDKLRDEALQRTERLAREHFAAFLERPLVIDRLAIFVEPEPEAPFLVHSVHPFGAGQETSTNAK